MKLFKNLLNSVKPHFLEGGKLEKLYPAYDAFETFLFVPDHTTHKGSHVRDSIDLKRTMVMVIVALIPCLMFGMWNVGHQYYLALGETQTMFAKFVLGFWKFMPLIIVSYGVGLAVEFAFAVYRGHSVNEGYLVTGLLIPLTMPIDVPLWMLAISVIFAVVIGKEVFGGTGMNILNPALTARAFLFFAYPTSMSGDKVWMSGLGEKMNTNAADLDGFSGATALGDLASFMSDKATVAGEVVQSSMAVQNFSNEYGAWEAFMGMIPGSIGETSTMACLIGGLLLVLTGVGSLRIIISFFAGGFIMGLLLNAIGGNPYLDLPAYYHLIIGGFAFGAVFMATDPVTASQTATGKIIYGFFGGFLAIMIRVLNPAYPEGVFLAILFMNVMAPIIDHYIVQANINRRLKRLKTA
jgi:Na+-transporting NADH:ubiquinone oxidoreductase subunit B